MSREIFVEHGRSIYSESIDVDVKGLDDSIKVTSFFTNRPANAEVLGYVSLSHDLKESEALGVLNLQQSAHQFKVSRKKYKRENVVGYIQLEGDDTFRCIGITESSLWVPIVTITVTVLGLLVTYLILKCYMYGPTLEEALKTIHAGPESVQVEMDVVED